MTDQQIIYPLPGGGLATVYPILQEGQTVEQVAALTVPEGTPYRIVSSADLPSDITYRDAWSCDFSDPDSEVVVDPALKAELVKKQALADLEDWFLEMTLPGFETNDGWRLGMTPQDVTLLTGYYVLAKEAAAMDLPIPPIIDKDGVPHDIAEIEELTAIMLGYGQRRAEISAEYAAKKAAILEQ